MYEVFRWEMLNTQNTPQKVKIHKHNLALTWVLDQHVGAKCLCGLTFCEVFGMFSNSQYRYENRKKRKRRETVFQTSRNLLAVHENGFWSPPPTLSNPVALVERKLQSLSLAPESKNLPARECNKILSQIIPSIP